MGCQVTSKLEFLSVSVFWVFRFRFFSVLNRSVSVRFFSVSVFSFSVSVFLSVFKNTVSVLTFSVFIKIFRFFFGFYCKKSIINFKDHISNKKISKLSSYSGSSSFSSIMFMSSKYSLIVINFSIVSEDNLAPRLLVNNRPR